MKYNSNRLRHPRTTLSCYFQINNMSREIELLRRYVTSELIVPNIRTIISVQEIKHRQKTDGYSDYSTWLAKLQWALATPTLGPHVKVVGEVRTPSPLEDEELSSSIALNLGSLVLQHDDYSEDNIDTENDLRLQWRLHLAQFLVGLYGVENSTFCRLNVSSREWIGLVYWEQIIDLYERKLGINIEGTEIPPRTLCNMLGLEIGKTVNKKEIADVGISASMVGYLLGDEFLKRRLDMKGQVESLPRVISDFSPAEHFFISNNLFPKSPLKKYFSPLGSN